MSPPAHILTGEIPSTTKDSKETKEGTAPPDKNWVPTTKVSVGLLAASLTTLLLP